MTGVTGETAPLVRWGYRAQVRSNDGSVWVNGGFFTKRTNAEVDAERMADLFGNEVRVIEQEDPLACL